MIERFQEFRKKANVSVTLESQDQERGGYIEGKGKVGRKGGREDIRDLEKEERMRMV